MENNANVYEELIEVLEYKIKLILVLIGPTFLLWIGDPRSPSMDSLSMSFQNNTTTLKSNGDDCFDKEFSLKLSNRLNKKMPVYVSNCFTPSQTNADLRLKLEEKAVRFVESKLN